MKKFLAVLLAAMFAVAGLTACGKNTSPQPADPYKSNIGGDKN